MLHSCCSKTDCAECFPSAIGISFSCGNISTKSLDTVLVYRTLIKDSTVVDTFAFYPDFSKQQHQITTDTVFSFFDQTLAEPKTTRFQLYSYVLSNPALKQDVCIKDIKVNHWEESGCCGCPRAELVEATINDTLVYRNGNAAVKLE